MRYKQLIMSFLPSIALGFGFMVFILLLKPSLPLLLLIVGSLSIIIGVYFKKDFKEIVKSTIINLLLLTFIVFLFKWLGAKGVIYITLGLILIPLIILGRRWKLFIKTLGDIEQEFFGRRFDRRKKRK